jgi:hypothetical protein
MIPSHVALDHTLTHAYVINDESSRHWFVGSVVIMWAEGETVSLGVAKR